MEISNEKSRPFLCLKAVFNAALNDDTLPHTDQSKHAVDADFNHTMQWQYNLMKVVFMRGQNRVYARIDKLSGIVHHCLFSVKNASLPAVPRKVG